MTNVYTSTRTSTTFTAGEFAPNASEAFDGAIIVNELGNLAITELVADPNDRDSHIELDSSVEPPVLRLKNVLATLQFGDTDSSGEFTQQTFSPNQMTQKVNGDYVGPESELKLT